MEYRKIGRTGMKVSALSFGASSLGSVFRETKESEAVAAVHTAVEGGMNFIDVSPYYGHYKAETVLTEVPEMFGAETILMDRAESRDVFDRIVGMITDFKDYFRSFGMPVYENPSPGNKAGGITTLEEKSLGCVQKGGTSAVVDVLDYACKATKPGLNLLTAPGNDLVAATALALSGCHMVLFTTGRGTPFGTCVPTMKISTNSQLASRKSNWVDFDAGILLENGDMEGIADSLMAKIVETANGSRLKHELTGAKEIAIFKSGVTL